MTNLSTHLSTRIDELLDSAQAHESRDEMLSARHHYERAYALLRELAYHYEEEYDSRAIDTFLKAIYSAIHAGESPKADALAQYVYTLDLNDKDKQRVDTLLDNAKQRDERLNELHRRRDALLKQSTLSDSDEDELFTIMHEIRRSPSYKNKWHDPAYEISKRMLEGLKEARNML